MVVVATAAEVVAAETARPSKLDCTLTTRQPGSLYCPLCGPRIHKIRSDQPQ